MKEVERLTLPQLKKVCKELKIQTHSPDRQASPTRNNNHILPQLCDIDYIPSNHFYGINSDKLMVLFLSCIGAAKFYKFKVLTWSILLIRKVSVLDPSQSES